MHKKRLWLRAPYSPFKWKILTFTGEIKMSCCNRDYDSSFASATSTPNPSPKRPQDWVSCSHIPSCNVTKNHTRTGLNPFNSAPKAPIKQSQSIYFAYSYVHISLVRIFLLQNLMRTLALIFGRCLCSASVGRSLNDASPCSPRDHACHKV